MNEDYVTTVTDYITSLPAGTNLHYEEHNESYHGRAAERILGIWRPRVSKGWRRHVRNIKMQRGHS